MTTIDLFLLNLYAHVEGLPDPEDTPVCLGEIAIDAKLSLAQGEVFSEDLKRNGFLKMSFLHEPPLLYITLTGTARAKRLLLQQRII
ncbi:hypothetical protein [Rufibacter immobilis]|uniref:hypothetical protein n=1 Tax=Rufibacter immobilis TaxID=1348778 RepID=UPI0035F0BDC3